jgi:hypothetical protein
MTPDELKTLLSTPIALFVIMLLGSLASVLKQIADAKKNGAEVTLGSYLAHIPETASALILNVLGFLTLVVTDQLNFASALGVGFASNSAADLVRTGGRSLTVGGSVRQSGFARPAMLALLLATSVIALPVMQGCTALGLQQPKTFSDDYAYALGQTTAVRAAAAQALNARQISLRDAEYVLQLTDRSRVYLDTAREVYEAGQTLEGKTQLELATAVLIQLQTFLNARAAK